MSLGAGAPSIRTGDSGALIGYRGMSKKKTPSGPRERIDTGRNKAFARRDDQGRFTEMTNVSRSLSRDRLQHAQHKKPARQGDRGD